MSNYSAFSCYGVELEYMLVDATTLAIAPVADQLLTAAGGAQDMEVVRGAAAWSNELALHVVETKTHGPTTDLVATASLLQAQVQDILTLLAPLGVRLLPSAMHPFMDPLLETRLWPHQNDEIYAAFDRIFDCRGHGWSNLQSVHINFPFDGDEQFGRVHAACRFVLPLLPALAASSPFCDGRRAPHRDQRLAEYRNNCLRVPSVTGAVIPERCYTHAAYQELLAGVYRDLAPLDPEGVLAEEWVNARGAIARFDRGAMEIRVIDIQECPQQDLAIVCWTTELVKALAEGQFVPLEQLMTWDEARLGAIFGRAVQLAEAAPVENDEYLRALGITPSDGCARMGDAIKVLISRLLQSHHPLRPALDLIGQQGTLSTRLLRALPEPIPSRDALREVYGKLADCLRDGRPFVP